MRIATTERFIVRADDKLAAFVELEAAIRASNGHDRAAVPSSRESRGFL
jgi:hypothetical protein